MEFMANQKKKNAIKKIARQIGVMPGLIIVSLTLLSGCQNVNSLLLKTQRLGLPENGTTSLALPLPQYVVGESFTFSDNRKQTVVEIQSDKVIWKTNNGVVRTTYRNPFIPYLDWKSKYSIATSESDADNTMLWPPIPGKIEYFKFNRTIQQADNPNSKSYSQIWECKSLGEKEITTPAGAFNTIHVDCTRYYPTKLNTRQVRSFYYSPELGYYASRVDKYKSGARKEINITKHEFDTSILSDEGKQALGKIVQSLLENGKSGQQKMWVNVSRDMKVAIQVDERTTVDGKICRDYKGVFFVEGRNMTNNRKACRHDSGLWIQA